jgi:hypothetical protein
MTSNHHSHPSINPTQFLIAYYLNRYGWQDRYGYLGRLDLQDVIDTLEPVRPGNEEVVVK